MKLDLLDSLLHTNPTLSRCVLLVAFQRRRGYKRNIALLWLLVANPNPMENPPQPLFPIRLHSPTPPVSSNISVPLRGSVRGVLRVTQIWRGCRNLFAHGIVGILQDVQQQQKPCLFEHLCANLILKLPIRFLLAGAPNLG